jgi:hypothetical protein
MGMKDPKTFVVKGNGKELMCPICGHNKFWKDVASVGKGFGRFGPGREAITLTCEECRHIIWFED